MRTRHQMLVSCLGAALAALLVSAALPAAAAASFGGEEGRIAFVRFSTGGQVEINVVDPDGGNLHGLGVRGRDPAWSPDGMRLLYKGGCLLVTSPACGIWVMNADGSSQTQLTSTRLDLNSGDDDGPSWSPDGRQVAFIRGRTTCGDSACEGDIWVMKADGSDQRRLTDTPEVDEADPSWSPDGSRIAFSSGVYPDRGIFIMRTDGAAVARLTTGSIDAQPDWSPDGNRIVFRRCCVEVWTMNADGSGQVGIPELGTGDTWPDWSPRGDRIVLSNGFTGFGDDLHIVPLNGGARTVLTAGGDQDFEADWGTVPNRPPDCTGVAASPATLSPPNHKFVTVALSGGADPDGDQVTLTITGVTQDEPAGDAPDVISGPAPNQVRLRAEREGRDDGRLYSIAFEVTDVRGGKCTGVATVAVPKGR